MQLSLKSVRVFYVTQLKFRTVVIQGFLITPCTNKSTITRKSKSLGILSSVKQHIKKVKCRSALKSVRVFYVTQLKFRTVVIQGFLITPCMNTSTITTKSKSLGILSSVKQHIKKVKCRSAWSQYESFMSLNSNSELCNSRFPHHTLHEYKHNHNKEQESRNSQFR